MSARLRSVVWVRAHEYEVTLELDGRLSHCLCRVTEHAGVRLVQATPDLLADLAFSPRLLAAALIAIDVVNDATGE